MTENATLLVVDDTPANLSVLLDYLPQHGFKVLVARGGARALEQVRHARPDLILLDVVMPGMDGFETCRCLKAAAETREIPVIFMTSLSEATDKVRAFEAGAVDYVTKPFQHEEVLARVNTHLKLRRLQAALEGAKGRLEERVAERTGELRAALAEVEQLKNRLQAENVYLQEQIRLEQHNFREIIGDSPPLRGLLEQVEMVAPTSSTVLILGETGTGKELIARAIHDRSERRARPLVKVNCSAISAGLVESELFGHVKGAFTGAVGQRDGRFALADGGTLFLDEIGELPLETQAKLLRVLQEGELEPVGSSRTRSVDVRVVTATHRDLEIEVREGRFRSDLFYRLNVLPLTVPSLRERREDIPLLVRFFLARFSAELGKTIRNVDSETMERLCAYDWPGNVRELQNVLERAVVLAKGPHLAIGPDMVDHSPAAQSHRGHPADGDSTDSTRLETLEELERGHIATALERSHGVIEGAAGAARILGLHPNTLRSRMKKLGVSRLAEAPTPK